MSINKILVCEDFEVSPASNIVLLSITDAVGRSYCSVNCHQEGYAAVIRLEVTRAMDVTAVIYDLLAGFDFDSKVYILAVRSPSQYISAMDVGFLLSALLPAAKIETDHARAIDGFAVHAEPVFVDTYHA